MPKESVPVSDGESFRVKIGWSEETVQIGVENVEGHSLLDTLYGDIETLRAIGRNFSGEANHTLSDVERGADIVEYIAGRKPEFTGVWSTLNRNQINYLIRLLRKARDRAFGADA